MIRVSVDAYGESRAFRFKREDRIVAWLRDSIKPEDYAIYGTWCVGGVQTLLVTNKDMTEYWLHTIEFKNADDAVAFKLGVGL